MRPRTLATTSLNRPGVAHTVRIALLDDDPDVRNALIELLETESSFEVVGCASCGEEGIRLVADAHPDVALVDAQHDRGEGYRAARQVLDLSPETRVVGFSAISDRETVLEMFRAGAIGYVSKESSPQELIEAIMAAAEGRPVVSSEISGEIVAELAGRLEERDLEQVQLLESAARIKGVLGDGSSMRVVFQPIVDLATHTIVGFEALTRFMAKPRRPPNEWFDEATRVGLGTQLEVESVRRATESLPELPASVYLSVNVSPETLPTPGLHALLKEVPLERLVVELTEHAIVQDYLTLGRSLRGLRERRLRFAVDDAGAGYASLRHIVRLAPDIIKLDAELTRGIEHDPSLRALATALISFAAETDSVIVAEGVESSGELNALRQLGVPFAQGFYLARPGPLPVSGRTFGAADSQQVASVTDELSQRRVGARERRINR